MKKLILLLLLSTSLQAQTYNNLKISPAVLGDYGKVFANNSTLGGYSVIIANNKSGYGAYFQNAGTGVMSVFNSYTGSVGDLIQFRKNDVITTKIDHNGIITTPTPAPGTNTNQVATMAAIQAEKRLIFRGLISQTGTSTPTLIILENNTGLSMTVARNGVGQYSIIPSVGDFNFSKTYYHLENNIDNTDNTIVLRIRQNDSGGITSGSLKINTTATTIAGVTTSYDDLLVKTPIEIIIYP